MAWMAAESVLRRCCVCAGVVVRTRLAQGWRWLDMCMGSSQVRSLEFATLQFHPSTRGYVQGTSREQPAIAAYLTEATPNDHHSGATPGCTLNQHATACMHYSYRAGLVHRTAQNGDGKSSGPLVRTSGLQSVALPPALVPEFLLAVGAWRSGVLPTWCVLYLLPTRASCMDTRHLLLVSLCYKRPAVACFTPPLADLTAE